MRPAVLVLRSQSGYSRVREHVSPSPDLRALQLRFRMMQVAERPTDVCRVRHPSHGGQQRSSPSCSELGWSPRHGTGHAGPSLRADRHRASVGGGSR